MPVPKHDPRAGLKRQNEALRRLKISPEDLATAPPITVFFKKAEGGITQVIAAMRFSQDEVVRAFLKKYDEVPVGDRERLPIEAIALAADVDLNHLLGASMTAIQAQAASVSRMLAMTWHPRITEARIKFGLKAGGERDRTAIDTALGVLQSPKGPTFIGKAVFGVAARDEEDGEESSTELLDKVDQLFPAPKTIQEKLNPIRQRLLT